jgi:hypothetical protein
MSFSHLINEKSSFERAAPGAYIIMQRSNFETNRGSSCSRLMRIPCAAMMNTAHRIPDSGAGCSHLFSAARQLRNFVARDTDQGRHEAPLFFLGCGGMSFLLCSALSAMFGIETR